MIFFFEYKRREEFSLFCLVYIRIYVFACVWDPFSNLFHHQLFSLNTETQHTNSCANKIDLSVKIIHISNILTHICPFIWNGGCVSHHFSLSFSERYSYMHTLFQIKTRNFIMCLYMEMCCYGNLSRALEYLRTSSI